MEVSRTRGEHWPTSLEKEQDGDKNLFGSLLGGSKGVEDKRIKEFTQGGQVVLGLTFACMSGRTERGARNVEEETGEELPEGGRSEEFSVSEVKGERVPRRKEMDRKC